MSAAEKLKALDDGRPGYIFAKRMKAALPQIVALVDAADYALHFIEAIFEEGDDPQAVKLLRDALAALDEALSPPTGGSP